MGKFIMTLTEADGEAEAPEVGRGGEPDVWLRWHAVKKHEPKKNAHGIGDLIR